MARRRTRSEIKDRVASEHKADARSVRGLVARRRRPLRISGCAASNDARNRTPSKRRSTTSHRCCAICSSCVPIRWRRAERGGARCARARAAALGRDGRSRSSSARSADIETRAPASARERERAAHARGRVPVAVQRASSAGTTARRASGSLSRAGVAQRQSSRFVIDRSRVQFPPPARSLGSIRSGHRPSR